MKLSYLLVDAILIGSEAQIYSQSYMALVDALYFQGENEKWNLITKYLPIVTKKSLDT